MSVGMSEGRLVEGCVVGLQDGSSEGSSVGVSVGLQDGWFVGCNEGVNVVGGVVGVWDGSIEGSNVVGLSVGKNVEGANEGDRVGMTEGLEGKHVGIAGYGVGRILGV